MFAKTNFWHSLHSEKDKYKPLKRAKDLTCIIYDTGSTTPMKVRVEIFHVFVGDNNPGTRKQLLFSLAYSISK